MKVISIILLVFLFLGALLYYLIQQSKKPSGIVGVLMMQLFNKAYLPMVRWALSFYNPSESPIKILDIGVGNGKSTALLAKNFPKSNVIGVEISEIAIKEAQKLPTTAVFQLENIQSTSFDNKTFDLICAFQTHFHWQDLKTAFYEIRRILTDEGIVLLACEYAKIRYYLPQYKDTQAFQSFLNTVGLQLVQEEKQQGWRFYKIKKLI
ncbi:class I SAM-dependent methyltransferase [Capnocytophaga granulosa]|uniref:class I SAM-dependent methyltransferase n=1 Tax=Capnocytophaga granulosa TaxID=45242 RepID=UPI0023F31CB0|nr:methyltransferase domain-containing protein [Capnocytophaga granulosa]